MSFETKFLQSITTAPSPKDYHKSTDLFHAVMKRQASPASCIGRSSTLRVYFSVQAVSGNETTYLLAEKDTNNGYTIVSTLDQSKIASLVRIQANLTSITYALYNHEGIQIATILYVVPSVASIVRDAPPRRAQFALRIANTLDVVATDTLWFEKTCKDSIRKTGTLDAVAAQTILFVSKNPYKKSNGRVGLNFHGRGRLASPKNMQLCRFHPTSGPSNDHVEAATTFTTATSSPIFIQMAKWEGDTYNIDFAAPITVLYAFAFGLAQLDL